MFTPHEHTQDHGQSQVHMYRRHGNNCNKKRLFIYRLTLVKCPCGMEMRTRLFLEQNIDVDVTTRPRSDETAQVDLDTAHWHTHIGKQLLPEVVAHAVRRHIKRGGKDLPFIRPCPLACPRSVVIHCMRSQPWSRAPPSMLAHAADS